MIIREYDRIAIRETRDLEHNTISIHDANYLQRVIIDNNSVFVYGNRCLIAQQYVGVIQLPEFSIEILPKIYGEVDGAKLRDVLIRMLIVANQMGSVRQINAAVSLRKNALSEILIQTFLIHLKKYVDSGLQHEYIKRAENLDRVKGRILFSQQLRKNVLAPTRFYCRYSRYEVNNQLNRFFKCCLVEMRRLSRDAQNKKMADDLLLSFDCISDDDISTVLLYPIVFNSINERARESYQYGKLFLENLYTTLYTGDTNAYAMMFDMDKLYEKFIFRVAAQIFGNRIIYQKMGNYLVASNNDNRRYVSLRPDLTLRISDNEQWIIDTKWKMPGRFAKESDVYQMNAYATGIKNVSKVVLLYPRVERSDHLTGDYTLLSHSGVQHNLSIRFVDLMGCLNWSTFLKKFGHIFN